VRDRAALLDTFALTPEFLRTAHDDEVVNYRDWGIQLGRRFRALKLWFVLRSFGADGLRARVRGHIAMAQELRGWIEAHPDFEPMAPTPFGLVCFRWRGARPPPGAAAGDARADAVNERILSRVNATGRAYLTHTKVRGRYTLRFAVGQLGTTLDDVAAAWALIVDAARDAAGDAASDHAG